MQTSGSHSLLHFESPRGTLQIHLNQQELDLMPNCWYRGGLRAQERKR